MTIIYENRHSGGYLVSEDEPGRRSRDQVTLKQQSAIREAGTILGKYSAASGTPAVGHGTNTGTGTLTLSAVALLAGVQSGAYNIVCIGGTYSVATPTLAGAGNGTCTLANPAFGAGVQVGAYKVRAVEKTTDSGEFAVIRPDGTVDGYAVVGAAYTGQVKFTIGDGSTDFDQTSEWSIVVSAAVPANGGVFSVTAPDGTRLANATVGSAYASQIGFTIADGTSADFVVGDSFTVTVSGADVGKYDCLNLTAVNGLQNAAAILFNTTDATAADTKVTVTDAACEVNGSELIYPVGATLNQKAAINLQLEALGIKVR